MGIVLVRDVRNLLAGQESSQAGGQYQRGATDFHNVDFALSNQNIQGAAAKPCEEAGIGDPHADGLDAWEATAACRFFVGLMVKHDPAFRR
jgi:hypothetical protein